MTSLLARIVALVSVWLVFSPAGFAQNMSPAQKAWDAATKTAIHGPGDIPFSDQAVLTLPNGMAYIPVTESAELMRLWGNAGEDVSHGSYLGSHSGSPAARKPAMYLAAS